MLHCAYEGTFDDVTMAEFFHDPRIFAVDRKQNELFLNPKFQYEISPRGQLVRTCVLAIQGILVKQLKGGNPPPPAWAILKKVLQLLKSGHFLYNCG